MQQKSVGVLGTRFSGIHVFVPHKLICKPSFNLLLGGELSNQTSDQNDLTALQKVNNDLLVSIFFAAIA